MGAGLQLHENGCVARLLEIMGCSRRSGGSSSVCEAKTEKLTELQKKIDLEIRTMQSCK
jgi:hypothetical protein